MVEKPKADVAPSNLAIVGRYVLSADIWPLLAKTPPGAGDEIQLTDAIDMLIEKETVEAYHMKGKSHDCGNKLGYMQAFVEYGIRHNTLGTEFKAWLEEEMDNKKSRRWRDFKQVQSTKDYCLIRKSSRDLPCSSIAFLITAGVRPWPVQVLVSPFSST